MKAHKTLIMTFLLCAAPTLFAAQTFSVYSNGTTFAGQSNCIAGTDSWAWNLHKTLYATTRAYDNVSKVYTLASFYQNQKNTYGWDNWVLMNRYYVGRSGEAGSNAVASNTYYYHFTPNWNQFKVITGHYRLEPFPYNPNGYRQIWLANTDTTQPSYKYNDAYTNCVTKP